MQLLPPPNCQTADQPKSAGNAQRAVPTDCTTRPLAARPRSDFVVSSCAQVVASQQLTLLVLLAPVFRVNPVSRFFSFFPSRPVSGGDDGARTRDLVVANH